MERFTVVTGTAAPLAIHNINTDAIIPAEWMRRPTGDLARALFAAWRFDEDGNERADFVLNTPAFRDARILIAGRNFGCGSSRENAVWALEAYGVRCVVAPSFSDIFVENCFKNGLLTIALEEARVEALAAEATRVAGRIPFTVDLVMQEVRPPEGRPVRFDVDPQQRRKLLAGLDDIAASLAFEDEIDAFQRDDRAARPWIYGRR